MKNLVPQLRTPGVIANELNVPLDIVLRILRTRSHLIQPIGRAGILRLYDRQAVEMVRAAISEQCRTELHCLPSSAAWGARGERE
jgi:hypothetical protein